MATEIDDSQYSMDPSSVQKPPPVEEDEWGNVSISFPASLMSIGCGICFFGLKILESVSGFWNVVMNPNLERSAFVSVCISIC